MEDSFRSPTDPVSKAVAALREQATTPGKSPIPPGTKCTSRPSRYDRRQERNHSGCEKVSIGNLAPSGKVTFSKGVCFSPKTPTRHRDQSSSPQPSYTIALRGHRSPISPYYTPTETLVCEPLPSISPTSTVKRVLCEQWDQYNQDYKDAILEHEIQYNARIQSVRNITGVTVALFFAYLAVGSCYYSIWSSAENKWPLHESLIFLIYTCSTVGYGNHDIPSNPEDRVVTIVFIMVGIGLVTVLLSEVFQYMTIAAEKARVTHEETKNSMRANTYENTKVDDGSVDEENQDNRTYQYSWDYSLAHKIRSAIFEVINFWRDVLERNTVWRHFVKFLPFIFFLVLGASVVGTIEGWSWIDSFYWATVTLTTVGYGDLTPTKPLSIWFCIFFLPMATIFLSLYLSKIAGLYMRLHVAQMKRVESRLEVMHKTMNEKDNWPILKLMPSGETNESLSPHGEDAFSSHVRISETSEQSSPAVMGTITGESRATTTSKKHCTQQAHKQRERALSMRDLLASTKRNKMHTSTRDIFDDATSTPSLGLRARVQERIAYIVATELCGEGPKIELQDNEIRLTLPDWKKTVEKWMIPKKAKEPLKLVTCELILSVGVTIIQERGVDALLELSTSKFQRSFNPVIAAFGHADCMEGWMISTNHLVNDRY